MFVRNRQEGEKSSCKDSTTVGIVIFQEKERDVVRVCTYLGGQICRRKRGTGGEGRDWGGELGRDGNWGGGGGGVEGNSVENDGL